MYLLLKNLFSLPMVRQKGTVATLCMVSVMFCMATGCDKHDSPPEESIKIDIYGGEDFYCHSREGNKENFKIRKDRAIIKTRSAEDAKALCGQNIFLFASDVMYVWVIAVIDPSITTLDDMMQLPGVVDAAYALEYADGDDTLYYTTNKISVVCKDGYSVEDILDQTDSTDSFEEIYKPYSNLFSYRIIFNTKISDDLRISRVLFESKLCEWADILKQQLHQMIGVVLLPSDHEISMNI